MSDRLELIQIITQYSQKKWITAAEECTYLKMLSSTYNVNAKSNVEDRVPKVKALLEQVRASKEGPTEQDNDGHPPPSLVDQLQFSEEDVFEDLEDYDDNDDRHDEREPVSTTTTTPFFNRPGRFPLTDHKRRQQTKHVDEMMMNKSHVVPSKKSEQVVRKSIAAVPLHSTRQTTSSSNDTQQIGNVNEMNHPAICNLKQRQIEDLFVSMAAFAKLGFVQPPCCLRCAYQCCALAGDDEDEEEIDDELQLNSQSSPIAANENCENLVLWRKNAGVLIQPSCMKDNVIIVKCKVAQALLKGRTVSQWRWDRASRTMVSQSKNSVRSRATEHFNDGN
uniref:Uncharacterized protein n=1 Tax=Leptocylindrus danicus TaxID=163516 RepID=A0A7S2JS45_9STRA